MAGNSTGRDCGTLSVCIATQDCAHKLVHAIESVLPVADEIIIVDGGSTDNTEELARSYEKVRYYFHKWSDNYAIQKNVSMDRAAGDWILILDSDEAIGVRMRRKIRRLMRSRKHDCYIFPRYWLVDVHPLRYIDSKKLYPDRQQRLFRNLPKHRYVESRKAHIKFEDGVQGVGKKIRDTHIFHFDFMYNDRKAREEKVRIRSGIAPETDHISRTHYLYEDYPYKIKKAWERLW
jgi:glycosyltransferase involved in cell wall biosynthesis